ncbi:MAG: AAA-like domain-containing protein [Myxococcota bacterium]
MARYFNTTGPIDVASHYALDPLARWDLSGILSLIDQRKYFLVHAPRQTGKTTCLQTLADYLNQQGHHACVYFSVERARTAGADIDRGLQCILDELAKQARIQLGDVWLDRHWREILQRHLGEGALITALQQWCDQSPKPVVLLIDEIDSLVDATLLSVLQQLRNGYCDRKYVPFPQSIVLCGMRDPRDYRMQLDRSKEPSTGPSPFNINSKSLRLGDFSQEDVKTLYAQHTRQTGQQFENGVVERVFELTQGQPWLVNALAYDACFEDKSGRNRSKTITVEDIDAAKERLIKRRETHLDQLMAKLKQERVHRVIASIMGRYDLHPSAEDFEYVTDLGLIRQDDTNSIVIANPVYREIIPRVLTAPWEKDLAVKTPALAKHDQPLDMDELLSAFQRFFREHSESWLDQFQYKEAGPQLLLQAFLQRTVNSRGSIQREQAVGSGRTDLIVTWPVPPTNQQPAACRDAINRVSTIHDKKQVIVLELKLIHRNDGAETVIGKGLQQTAGYMDRFHAPEGHLILFDRREGKSWDERVWTKRETAPDGKKITVWAM